MKKIKTTDIGGGSGMPVKKGTMQHLQDAYREIVEATIRARIGDSYDTTKAYLLYGLKRTGSGLVFNVTAGALFFNGEVYIVDAFSFTAAGGQTAVGTITTTFFSDPIADPTRFTDGSDHDIHEIRKIVFSSAVAGSGDIDFVNLIQYLEEDDYVDLTSLASFNASLTTTTARKVHRYKNGDLEIKVNSNIGVDIASGDSVITGLPNKTESTHFFAQIKNSSTNVISAISVNYTGTGVTVGGAIAAATYSQFFLYIIIKSE